MRRVTDGLLSISGGLSVLGCCLELILLLGGGIALGSIGFTGYVSGSSVGSVAGGVIVGVVLLGVGIHRRWYHGWSHGIRRIPRDIESVLLDASECWLLNRFWVGHRGGTSGDSWYEYQRSGDTATDHGTRPQRLSLETEVINLQ